MKRAAIYVRVSSERQAAEDRVSVEAQLTDCEAYCQARGYTVVAKFIDKERYRVRGKLVQPSGQRKDRPEYQALLKAALAGAFDVIVAWKEDRLYRGMYAAMPFSEVLDELGRRLDVELVRETFDQKMLAIKAAVGKLEVDNIRERMIMGRRARLERGEVPGGDQVRYGYHKVNKRLEVNEAEAQWVRNIFDWYIAGENNMQIRKRLNVQGVLPRKGKLWAKPTLETILTTETYATGKMTTTLDGETFEIPCQPIISLETWRKAQQVRQNNRYMARNVKEDYLCIGLVRCVCGWKCHARTIRSNRRRGYTSVSGAYYCQKVEHQPEATPANCFRCIGSKKVDDYVWAYVRQICSRPAVLQQAITAKITTLQAQQDDLEVETNRLEKQLETLHRERQWVITQARKGNITEDDMQMQLTALQEQEHAYRRELDEKQAITSARQQAEALSSWAGRYLSEIQAGIQVLDVNVATLSPEQREALATELDSYRFADKFPGDALAQLRWAILEEKRRVVRTLIDHVIVGRGEERKQRKITPILALNLPSDIVFLASGDQSLEYVMDAGAALA